MNVCSRWRCICRYELGFSFCQVCLVVFKFKFLFMDSGGLTCQIMKFTIHANVIHHIVL